jgi:hypothetical protein
MKITIPVFKGMRPLAAAHLLAAGEAQAAADIDIAGGDLRAVAKPLKIETLSGASVKGFRRWTETGTDHWLEYGDEVDIVKGPVADDAFERVFVSGVTGVGATPRFFANDNVSVPFDQAADFIKLGVPAPTGALTASGYTAGGTTYRAYCYTYVNRYGEEGPPSPLEEFSDYTSGNVTLTGFTAAPADRAIDKIRVYRVNTSGAEYASFQLVFATDLKIYSATASYYNGDLVVYSGSLFKCVVAGPVVGVTPVGSAAEWDVWYDGIADASLQPDTLVSLDWDPPPDALAGLCALPNGCLAGFVGTTVYLTEPYYPHAWPQGSYLADYRYMAPAPVVAIKPHLGSLVVMTEGPTIILGGSSPDQLTPVELPGMYPCRYKRSATKTPGGVMYMSRHGLVLANSDGLAVVTKELLSERDWVAYTTTAALGVYHDGKYIGFANNTRGFVIDFELKTFYELSFYASAVWAAEDDGALYLVKEDDVDPSAPPATVPLAVMRWAGDDIETLYYSWRSGELRTPAEVNFGAARVTIDEIYFADVADLVEENATVEDYNADIFTAATVDGGLGGAGLAVFGLAGDRLRSLNSLSIGSSVTFKWYASGVLKHSRIVTNSRPFRLPPGFRSKRFEIGLEGYVPVKMVEVASGMEELYSE